MASSRQTFACSAEFRKAFADRAGPSGVLSFEAFMELALYHPDVGYYRAPRRRVGREAGADFFTATSLGPLFGELVSAACQSILQTADRDPSGHGFVEIGAEPGDGGILQQVSHPFSSVRVLRLGAPLAITGDCVVFSNELFDAQPCRRLVFRGGRWREIGVALDEGGLREVELESAPSTDLPDAADGYVFDQPHRAAALADQIAAQPWRGLFLAFDYGKTLRQLLSETPAGTVRSYHHHRQSSEVLARAGEKDLTCHVCWDWISEALRRHGFDEPQLSFQESFLVRHAGPLIASVSQAEATRLSQRKLALMQLLHPSHFGQKFQVLHALR